MSSIYSNIYSSDRIQEPTNHYHYSSTGKSIDSQIYTPSKRSILREVNRKFQNQMNQMELCLQSVKNKYRSKQEAHQKCASNFSIPTQFYKNHRTTFQDARSTNIENFQNTYQSQLYSNIIQNNNYDQAIAQQRNFKEQIQIMRQMLGDRISNEGKVQLEQYPKKGIEINWDLLMRQDESAYIQLLKTEAKMPGNYQYGSSTGYIAYTQANSMSILDRKETSESKMIHNDTKQSAKCNKNNLSKEQQRPQLSIKSQQKIYQDIQTRIKKSPCVVGNITHSKQIDLTNQLFNRLSKEKEQREKLIKNIKFQYK